MSPHLTATGVPGRILTMIDQRKAIALQHRLSGDMGQMRGDLTHLRGDLGRHFDTLHNEMQSMQTTISAKLDAVGSLQSGRQAVAVEASGTNELLQTLVNEVRHMRQAQARMQLSINEGAEAVRGLQRERDSHGGNERAPAPTLPVLVLPCAGRAGQRNALADFVLPHGASARHAWNQWWVANDSRDIVAVRFLQTNDVVDDRSRRTLKEWRNFIELMLCLWWQLDPASLVFANVTAMATTAAEVWASINDALLRPRGLDDDLTPATLNKRLRRLEGHVYMGAKQRNQLLREIEEHWARGDKDDSNDEDDSDGDEDADDGEGGASDDE